MKNAVMIAGLCLLLGGCSVAMSSNRTTYKGDPAMIQVGAERQLIESTFGPPNMTASLGEGKTKAIYKIDPDAATAGGRNAAIAGNVVADILTLGLWEIVATPIEISAQDKFTNYIVVYTADQRIESVETVR
jgi:hypothetical protein